jgi:putative hydrolase of HD superfamily
MSGNGQTKLEQIAIFLKESEKLKLVERIPYLSDKKRRENDAEHSWHLALMVMVLSKDLDPEVDVAKACKMAIIHDLAEVYTGDDWVTDQNAKAQRQIEEKNAFEKLCNLLPNDIANDLKELQEEYEEVKTPEAKLVKALDKICYVMQYSFSQKEEWDKGCTRKQTEDYAIPHFGNNQEILNLFTLFTNNVEKYKSANLIDEE